VDDDCDGDTDEEALDVGSVCSAGEGECLAFGVTWCQRGAPRCGAVPRLPAPEVCNGMDDDCDGEIDDSPRDAGLACTAGSGDCAGHGTVRCEHGQLRCDAVGRRALPERCNGEDDDCDGEVDEGPVFSTAPRRVSPEGVVARGAVLAATEAGYLLAWEQDDEEGGVVYVLPLDPAGDPLDEPRRASGDAADARGPVLTALPDGAAIAWNEVADGVRRVHTLIVDEEGRGVSGPRPVSDGAASTQPVALVPAADGLTAAWYDDGAARRWLWLRRLDMTGAPAGPGVPVGQADRAYGRPAIVASNGGLALAWMDLVRGVAQIMFGLLDGDGTPLAPAQQISHGLAAGHGPGLIQTGDALLAAWPELFGMTALPLAADGTPGDAQLVVRGVNQPAMAWTGAHAALAATENVTGGRAIAFMLMDASGVPATPPISLNSAPTGADRPVLLWDRGHFAVAWHDDRAEGRTVWFSTGPLVCGPADDDPN